MVSGKYKPLSGASPLITAFLNVALGAIFDNIAGEISDNNDAQQNLPPQERPPKPPPPEENQDEQTENGNNTPGDT